MTVLRNACSATDTLLDIDTPLGIDAYPLPYTLGSEVVNVVGGGRARSITVQRGAGGSTAAAHVNGTALTAANAFAGSSGSISVTDGTTTVDPATSIRTGAIAAGAPNEAVLLPVIFAITDPGNVGAGMLWVQDHEDGHYSIWVRDSDDANWLSPGAVEALHYTSGGILTSLVSASPNVASLLGESDDHQTQAAVNADAANGVQFTMAEPGGGYFQAIIPPLATEFQMWDASHGMPYPGIFFKMGTADPSAAGGVVAPAGSFYSRLNGAAGELWFKTGASDTSWSKLTP
jgi:hypothetical protein